jgi:hypothetical protein
VCSKQLIATSHSKEVRMLFWGISRMRTSLLRRIAMTNDELFGCTLEIFVTNDRKYQTCLIFVVHDTSDKNPEYFPRTCTWIFVARVSKVVNWV